MYCEKCGALLVDGKCPNCDTAVPSKKKRNVGMMVFAVLLSIISIGLLAGGFYLFTSPKTIVLQSITDWNSSLKKATSVDSTLSKKIEESDKLGMDLSYQLHFDTTLGLDIDDITAHMVYASEKNKKLAQLSFDSTIGDMDFLSLDAILKENTVYLKIKDIMDKYYFQELDSEMMESASYSALSVEDINQLIDIVTNNMKEMIDSENLDKTSETITLGEQEKKTTKITYHVTKTKMYQLIEAIFEDVKSEDSLVQNLAETLGITKEELIQMMDEDIQSMKKDTKEEDFFDYHVYYYGFNNIVMEEISDDEVALQYYHYDDTKEFHFFDKASQTNYLTVKSVKDKDTYQLSGYLTTYSFEGTYVEKEKESSLSLEIEVDDENTLMLNYTNRVVGDYERENTLSLGVKTSGVVIKNAVVLKGTVRFVFDQTIDTSVLEDAKDINLMTPEESALILEKMQQHPLFSMISNLWREQFDDSLGSLDDSTSLDDIDMNSEGMIS